MISVWAAPDRETADRLRTEWQPIETAPTAPKMVALYYNDIPVYPGLPDYRDERWSLGFFDGNEFRELGTGHLIFEGINTPPYLPTHWMPLPEPPK
jgi:hypothetical protein